MPASVYYKSNKCVMKNLSLLSVLLILLLGITPACSKSGSGGGGACTETGIGFTSSPAVNTTETPAPGPDFPLSVTVTNLPSAGATISVSAKPEAGGAAFFTQSKTAATSGATSFTITGAALNVVNVVEITVTSKSCATNKATGTYKFSRK